MLPKKSTSADRTLRNEFQEGFTADQFDGLCLPRTLCRYRLLKIETSSMESILGRGKGAGVSAMSDQQECGAGSIGQEESGVRLEISTAPQINFAFQQNAVPVLREIGLANVGEHDLHDLTLDMRASPAFLAPKIWHIDRLPTEGLLHINDRDIRLDGKYLLDLRESQQGELIFTLRNKDGGLLAEYSAAVEVLARNEWGGYGNSPELLAAFCMPNEVAVEKLLRSTSDLLRSHGHDGTLHSYQKADAKRVWQQVSAVWSAALGLKLDYAYPPASFQASGQKVRTADAIVETRRATCLDTSLLLAAAFEQIGLHPIVVLDRGHAYVGVWLKQESFAFPFTDDLLSLRKRVRLRELLVIESTLLCQHATFKMALLAAENHLDAEGSEFAGVVDIARSRDERIRPLSFVERIATDTSFAAGTESSAAGFDELPEDADLLGGESIEWAHEGAGPGGRLGQWQRRLLDLSLRNPLLNMRSSRTNIALMVPNPGLLEDLLAEGKALSIETSPGSGSRDSEIHWQRTGSRLDEEAALAALKRCKVYAQIEAAQLEASLVELYRKARNDLEEGGSNTLFLAVGMLHWQRPGVDERIYRAPLVLLPVTITRQSVRSGVKLTLSDDEPRFNTTLLELLRQDFDLDIKGLEGPLPQDSSGTDIATILTRMRHEVRDVAGFEVRDEVHLGTFSFAKYLMWKDLVDRVDKLKDNSVVRHLMETPREPFREVSEFVDPRALDELIEPESLFTPLSADSSQLAAVVAAAGGKNFVMIGPPGTGKSQTIANIIAHNLGLGRTVLFVSEKAAALDVVYRRLRENGLGEFCLELHSNKARKLDVIRQLGEAWEAKGKLSKAEWEESAGQLRVLRDQLNQVVKALHERHHNGLSIREGISLAAGNAAVPQADLSWANANQHSNSDYRQLLAVGERIDLNAAEIGDLKEHPLGLLHTADWSMGWQQAVLAQAADMSAKAKAWLQAIQDICQCLGLPDSPYERPEKLRAISSLVATLRDCAGNDMTFSFATNGKSILDAVSNTNVLIKEFVQQRAGLSCKYDRTRLLRADLGPAEESWYKAEHGWWLSRVMGSYKCRSYLRKQVGAAAKPDPAGDLPILFRLQAINSELGVLAPLVEKVGGWQRLDSDMSRMNELARVAGNLRASIGGLVSDADKLVSVRTSIRNIVVDGNDALAADASLGVQLADFIRLERDFKQSLAKFSELSGRIPEEMLDQGGGLEALAAAGEQIHSAQNKLNTWCAWRRVRSEAVDLGMYPVIQAIEAGWVAAGKAKEAITVNYARWWVAQMIDTTPVLRQFVSVEHERRILNFREIDAKVRSVTSECIRTRIRGGLIEKEDAKRSSEFGIIRRELEKKTRHKPLRQLISEAPNAIPQLTPCLLMSPLSIAQYLPVEQKTFDLVIFDEASQITVWDAIGAIARGKQTIVVGDPKQLPPTSFFSVGQSEDTISDDDEDLESILDEMLGANMPTIHLSWHYRSRNESLITFSNHRYYQGGLVTFPSPVTQDTAVSLEFVGGTYGRGGGQINRTEADAIVAEIERRLLDPVTNGQTLGVVTFNQKQQTLILDLLDAARRNNSDLDRFFAEDMIEPVFVKNLEAVQGDERDVIFFSTTFGPDQTGRLSMNFGPLNKNGGERRLNVAITRARIELKVFSSMRAEQIDLSRTAALGVRDLKHFLEFAEKGVRALGEAVFGSHGDFDSPLEAAVARDLCDRGWILHPQVGVSSFRIDLGVVDPEAPGRYLAGIECDGATYHRSATARDRDLVREGVLRGLGWQILRLWSTDYWLDPVGIIDKLDRQLRLLHQDQQTAKKYADADESVTQVSVLRHDNLPKSFSLEE